MKVVGVDPGGRDTGVLLRSRDEAERVAVIHLPDSETRPTNAYLVEVVFEIAAAVDQGRSPTGRDPIVAVEDLDDPSWWIDGEVKPINPGYLIGVSIVIGAVLLAFPSAIVVPPNKHGSRHLDGYPREIIGGPHNERWPRAEPKGKGVLRHARSAWDVAQAGLLLARAKEGRRTE